MKSAIKDIYDTILSSLPMFEDNSAIVLDREDYKKNWLNDKKKNLFYLRVQDIDALSQGSFSQGAKGLKNLKSSWVGVFQLNKDEDVPSIFSALMSIICNHSCVTGGDYSCVTDKIYKNEKSILANEDQGAIRYSFNLVYFSFQISEESTGDICIKTCE